MSHVLFKAETPASTNTDSIQHPTGFTPPIRASDSLHKIGEGLHKVCIHVVRLFGELMEPQSNNVCNNLSDFEI